MASKIVVFVLSRAGEAKLGLYVLYTYNAVSSKATRLKMISTSIA